MRASDVDLSAEQLYDISKCVVLWRKVGLSSVTVSCYRNRVSCLLKRTGITDYGKLSADVVEHASRSYARQLRVKRLPAQRQWMSAFRAFSWALNALGKAGPAITTSRRSKDSKEETDPVMSDLGLQPAIGWTEGTCKAGIVGCDSSDPFYIGGAALGQFHACGISTDSCSHIVSVGRRVLSSKLPGRCERGCGFSMSRAQQNRPLSGRDEPDPASVCTACSYAALADGVTVSLRH